MHYIVYVFASEKGEGCKCCFDLYQIIYHVCIHAKGILKNKLIISLLFSLIQILSGHAPHNHFGFHGRSN
jgi:hypothetical protein